MNGTVNRVKRELNWSEFSFISHSSETENKPEAVIEKPFLHGGAFSARYEEKVVLSRIFFSLTGCTILDEPLPFERKLFSLLDKQVCKTFETLLQEVLTENGSHYREPRTTLTFASSGYAVGGFMPSLDHYDQEKCYIMKPNGWPRIFREYL